MHFESYTTVKQFSEMELQNNIPKFLLSFLRLTGLVEISDQNVKCSSVSRTIDILVFVMFLDLFVITLMDFEHSESKIDMAYLSSFFLTITVWFILRYKKKGITHLLQKSEGTSSSFREKILNFMILLNYCMPLTYSAFLVCSLNQSEAARYFFYGCEVKYISIQTVITGIKSFLGYMIFPTFGNIVALLYIFLCFRSSDCLNNLSWEIEKSSLEDFTLSKQISILKKRTKIYYILLNIQNNFSLPIFFVIVANILICGCITGWFLIIKWDESDFLLKMESVFFGTNALVNVISILWTAGNVSVEMSKFKEIFHYKTHLKLLSRYSKQELHFKMDLMNEPEFVLTGWDVLPLRRSMILGLIGTLLTYTVLVMNTNGSEKINVRCSTELKK
ncbi:uncharacterized protein NPIL_509621 [Nephila pilipes]|uniref:Gustatory receptor n=1 Tax=Nephila pilipes TaxID=299642 RepID=A0A8X6TAS4_NEPPI|nr:uncharacterized protein NPIL_509621 [Nephila pilipes]